QAPLLESDTARSLALDHRPRGRSAPGILVRLGLCLAAKADGRARRHQISPGWADHCATGGESPGGAGSGPASSWLAPPRRLGPSIPSWSKVWVKAFYGNSKIPLVTGGIFQHSIVFPPCSGGHRTRYGVNHGHEDRSRPSK